MPVTVSLLLVTHGRPEIVAESLESTFRSGIVDEVIWVDNRSPHFGELDRAISTTATKCKFPLEAFTVIKSHKNRGVAWALNRAAACASGEIMLITDGDFAFPSGCLKSMLARLKAEPGIDVVPGIDAIGSRKCMAVSCYNDSPENMEPRFWSEDEEVWGEGTQVGPARFRKGLVMGARMFERDLLELAGWFREDFGLVKWDDVEWAHRVKHYCDSANLDTLVITSAQCEHIPDRIGESYEYKYLKSFEAGKAEEKSAKLHQLAEYGWPRWCPFPVPTN